MKKTYLILSCLFMFALFSSAQSGHAVIFTELGETFTAFLNGEQQNEIPSNNVKINDLNMEFYQIRIDFEDSNLPDFHNNNFVISFGQTTSYIIKATKKGKYVLRFGGSTPTSTTADVAKPEPAAPQPDSQKSQVQTKGDSDVQITHRTTTTTTTTAPNGDKVSINMNLGGNNVSLSMDVDEVEMSHSETTTTTTTSSGSINQTNVNETMDAAADQNSGPCARPMSDYEFADASQSISGKDFEDSKMVIAKQITKSKCLTADQVEQVMRLFDFEESRLDFAKFAFDYTFDPDNYFKVNDAFEFELTIEELQDFLNTK